MPDGVVDLQLLGHFECRVDGRRVPVSPRGRRLLALVALQGPQGLSRRVVGQVLWPERPTNRQKANVRGVLHRLPPSVTAHLDVDDAIRLDDSWDVDHARAVRLAGAADAVGAGGEEPPLLTPEQLAQPLLPEWDEPWLDNPRQRFEDLRLRAMEALARWHWAEGHQVEALTVAETALAARPTRQTAASLVVELHLEQGNVDDALSVSRRFTETLDADLGASPTDDFLALIADLGGRSDATATL